MHASLSHVEAWLLCKRGSGRSIVHALSTVHSETAAIPVVSGRSTRADVDTSLAKKSVVHISMVCIQAWFALKPDAESGLYAYKPGFYPRLYGISFALKPSCCVFLLSVHQHLRDRSSDFRLPLDKETSPELDDLRTTRRQVAVYLK